MIRFCRKIASVLLVVVLLAPRLGVAATPVPPAQHIDVSKMLGRWYEVARLPNRIQKDCQGGTSDWTKTADGFAVIQACHNGALTDPPTLWKAKAKVVDPVTNARIKMSFFGGVLTQEYWVLADHPDQGWLVLGTPNGKSLWLMSHRPNLAASSRAQALARIRQLGYDVADLEFHQPAVR
jgi:apolipoprotein D and lipocalin family protein